MRSHLIRVALNIEVSKRRKGTLFLSRGVRAGLTARAPSTAVPITGLEQ